ncbi:MAG: hypothetical protein FWH46_01770 [Methanimicrococcus sp.]|nr:hypothetical protein [Methanimicrococcus sp.]
MKNKVKIISLLTLITILTTAMVGCINPSPDEQDMLVGQWNITDKEPAITGRSVQGGVQGGEPLYIIFRDNGTFYTEWGDHSYYSGSYNITNNTTVSLYDDSIGQQNQTRTQDQLYASGYIDEDNTLYLDVYMGDWASFTLEFYN